MRACGDCVFYEASQYQCTLAYIPVETTTAACREFTPIHGDTSFKPMLNVKIERNGSWTNIKSDSKN